MKNYVILFALVFFFSGISIANPNPDDNNALDAIHGFYKAMSTFEYDQVGEYCTSDFGCIDNAVYYKTLDEFVALIKTFEGAEMKYNFQVEKSKMDSKSGLIIMTFNVDIKMGEEEMHITALENYVMKKEKGKWLIDFIHSSPTSPIEY